MIRLELEGKLFQQHSPTIRRKFNLWLRGGALRFILLAKGGLKHSTFWIFQEFHDASHLGLSREFHVAWVFLEFLLA